MAVISAVFFAILFLAGNVVLQSVRERIGELAVLKTLGFSDTGVLGRVTMEALVLCLVAAGIGLAATALFPFAARVIGRSKQGKTVVMVTHDPRAVDHASRRLYLD